jgi:predicted GNAT family acetyltransferase
MHEIQHILDGNRGSFYIEINSQKVATMDYVMVSDKKMIIEHTWVDVSLKGQGVGKKLLDKLVVYSREHHLSVMPKCSFANAILNKTPELQDVLS